MDIRGQTSNKKFK